MAGEAELSRMVREGIDADGCDGSDGAEDLLHVARGWERVTLHPSAEAARGSERRCPALRRAWRLEGDRAEVMRERARFFVWVGDQGVRPAVEEKLTDAAGRTWVLRAVGYLREGKLARCEAERIRLPDEAWVTVCVGRSERQRDGTEVWRWVAVRGALEGSVGRDDGGRWRLVWRERLRGAWLARLERESRWRVIDAEGRGFDVLDRDCFQADQWLLQPVSGEWQIEPDAWLDEANEV